jgi:transposase|tara:strand:+ start:219 stop:587 length:369 start_codon:yes stop_codon:yes gene_type:complete
MGRKTKLQDDIQHRLISAIEKGLTIVDACEYAGISEKTYYNWLNKDTDEIKDEEERKKFVQFLQDIKKAQSECQMYCLDFIMKDKSWQSKAWLLERRFPDRWAKKDMTINENNEKVINFTYG